MVAHNFMWHKPPCLSASSPDPGNLRDVIDEDILPLLRLDHVAIDEGAHVTLEDLERIEADILPVASWLGVRS